MTGILRKYLKSYKVLVLLSAFLTLLVLDYMVITHISANIDKKAESLERKVRSLKINETEQKLKELDTLLKRYGLPEMGQEDARGYLLDTLEEFRRLYRAKVKEPVNMKDSSFRAGIEFTFAPERPEDALRLLEYLKNSTAPIYTVKSVSFRYNRDVRSVVIETDLVQPFAGGGYVY